MFYQCSGSRGQPRVLSAVRQPFVNLNLLRPLCSTIEDQNRIDLAYTNAQAKL